MTMVRIRRALLCDYGTLSVDGKASAIGLFSVVHATAFPVVHPSMYLVFEIDAEDPDRGSDVDVRIDGVNAKGERLFTVEGGGKVPPEPMPEGRSTFWQVLRLPPLPLETPGRYPITITVNGTSRLDVAFHVRQVVQNT